MIIPSLLCPFSPLCVWSLAVSRLGILLDFPALGSRTLTAEASLKLAMGRLLNLGMTSAWHASGLFLLVHPVRFCIPPPLVRSWNWDSHSLSPLVPCRLFLSILVFPGPGTVTEMQINESIVHY